MFALRKFLVLNRIWIGLVLIALGIYIGIENTWWIGWLPIFIGVITILAHFLIGPVTLLQKFIEGGDVEGAQKLIKSVKYPDLLVKPIRSAYYMLKANFSSMNDNFDEAEEEIKKSLATGSKDKDYQGTAYLQLGSISYRKGNTKEAYEHLRKAISMGLPDADSNATAYLQMSSICMTRRDFKTSKMYFNKAVAAKAKNPQILEQLAEMKKYIARMPG